ncbi:hypothetical protein SAMN02910409_1651 [Prevotellaceae bacterium HUN156]|jgi:hypothetical protein|nr:hypothetical protein SAMN02910409_1651 [Prevotellaceae bacterium HUN156]
MKKIVLTLVALMSMTMTFAESASKNIATVNNSNKSIYNMTVNMKKLAKALELTDEQVEGVAEIHKTFSSEMMNAAEYGNEERAKLVEKAINKDLAYMNTVLNKDQYHKYLTLLNVTLVNRGMK